MHQVNIVLVGCDEGILPDIRREVLSHSAIIEDEFPDLPSALKTLESRKDDARMFVVHIGSDLELAQLKRLNSVFRGCPIIALVDAERDASMVVKAMRAGALQIVLLPCRRADFKAALDCIAAQLGWGLVRAKTIAVAGATGGCGTSTIALNLTYELALAKHVKCILVELSLRMGLLAYHLDVEPRYSTSDLLFNKNVDSYQVNDALTAITDNFSILPGPYRSIEPGIINSEDVLALIELVTPLAAVVVLDVPCTFDDLFFKTLSAADEVVIITQQKVSSIRGAQMICEALPDLKPLIVVNRYDPKLHGFSGERLRSVLGRPRLTTVASDPVVGDAVDHGRPLRLQDSGSRALSDIIKLMEALAPQSTKAKQPAEPLSFFGRIGRALSFSAKD